MVARIMWFKRDPKPVSEKVEKLRKKKPSLLKPTRESSERETSTESDKERRRYSDILDIKTSLERRDESDESLYESADGHSDTISASDDALPRLKTPTMSKESLKLAITDEEVDNKFKKGHRKAISLSNPLEMVKHFGDEWQLTTKKEVDKNCDKKKSRESLWSEEDRESIHGSTNFLDQIRRCSKKEDKSQNSSRKSSNTEAPKTRKSSKGSSVGSFNFLRRKKTPTSLKPVEVVPEDVSKILSTFEVISFTKLFLTEEQRYCSIEEVKPVKPPVETDTEDELPTPRQISEQRRRLSRQTSRSKSKVRGKSQSLKVNTLRKSHSGTLKKGKKKNAKTPSLGRSRQASIVEQTPLMKKKNSDVSKPNSWLFGGPWGESKREGSNEEPAPDGELDTSDATAKEPDKDNSWRAAPCSGRGVNRAESCRDRSREVPRRGKHRNASDPNRLTAHNNHDLEPGAPTAPSGSSSSSSLSSRSNESNTVAADPQASQSEYPSEEDEPPLAAQWADSIPPHVLESLALSHRLRKRQEVIHELIVSESSHLRWLKVLGKVFLKPLEGQPSLIPPEELKALFPNLPSVKERHAKLYAELRALRLDAESPLVEIRGVADAILNTMGESGYAPCLSWFCRDQRLALERLRERRRKHKELHQHLCAREQLPLCGRLQLKDLLACVWQRLTKYQLLLEGIMKTVNTAEGDTEEDVSRLQMALTVAKEVLHAVDTAVRTAENLHRLRSIQSKLEVRAPSVGEWEELRRLELTAKALRLEGELSLKHDTNKKTSMLALMMEDSLVLLQKEGDKFVLKPISHPTQQPLSPLVKWDKVIFRPNAAVKNTFFLMNINGVQMHELSANTAAEYSTWVKHIEEAPLAKLTELKLTLTPSHHVTRSTDDSGINVSRNPSDASEKSSSTIEDESERDRTSAERSSTERERDANTEEKEPVEEEKKEEEKEKEEEKKEEEDEEERLKPRRPTVGRTSLHSVSPPALESSAAVLVATPTLPLLAERVYTQQERLRRLDDTISEALHSKAALVCEMLNVPPSHYSQLADLAVAEARGEDISLEFRGGMPRLDSVDAESDMQQLILAAFTQVSQLTNIVRQSLHVSETAAVAARARTDSRQRHNGLQHDTTPVAPSELTSEMLEHERRDLDAVNVDQLLERESTNASVCLRIVEEACGLQATLSRLLSAGESVTALRQELAAQRDQWHALLARTEHHPTEEIPFNAGLDPTIQQPSNGG